MRRNCRQASTRVQISVETINIVVHVRMCKSVKAAKMMITYAACLWCMKV